MVQEGDAIYITRDRWCCRTKPLHLENGYPTKYMTPAPSSDQILTIYSLLALGRTRWCLARRWRAPCTGSVGVHVHVLNDNKGSGALQGGMGCSHSRGLLADILVDLVFGMVFTVFGVRSHLCSCLLAVDRQVLGTHGVGWCVEAVFTPFTALCDAHRPG